MAITLTEPAAERVTSFLENRGKGVGLRLGVKTMGCSGMGYVLEFVDDINDDDEVFEDHGVKVIVDNFSNLSFRLAHKIKFDCCFANSTAHASPIPLLAPVINTILSFKLNIYFSIIFVTIKYI